MQDLFITKIHVEKVRNIKNLDITLSESECKHLILTGKNGSGKTSLLSLISAYLEVLPKEQGIETIMSNANGTLTATGKKSNIAWGKKVFGQLVLNISPNLSVEKKFAVIYFPADHNSRIQESQTIRTKPSDFLNYLNILGLKQLRATEEKRKNKYQNFYDKFVEILKELYDDSDLLFEPSENGLNFVIKTKGHDPFLLTQLSDGYSAFLNIFMEILMKIGGEDFDADYRQEAIVLIDEIETHLHVELQKRVMPFLTKMFPNVQFLVATHSPFVITSLDNAVVFDLEKAAELQALGQDTDGARLDSADSPLTSYSYEDIVEGYYDVSGYSATFAREFSRYKELCRKGELTDDEKTERAKLKTKLSLIPASAKTLRYQIAQFEREGNANG
jgi:predicted ATPase